MKTEFWITDIIEKKGQICWVAGQITEGLLRVGTVFTSACNPMFSDNQRAEMNRINTSIVALTVVRMEFRGEEFSELIAGDTPGLKLSGSGLDFLKPDTLLSFEA